MPTLPPAVALADMGWFDSQFFIDTCDLYAPSAPVVEDPATGHATQTSYPAAPTYRGVPCFYDETPEFLIPGGPGLIREQNIMTQTKFYFTNGQPVAAGWWIKLTTPGHPDAGAYWKTQGNTQDAIDAVAWKNPNLRMIYARRQGKPAKEITT